MMYFLGQVSWSSWILCGGVRTCSWVGEFSKVLKRCLLVGFMGFFRRVEISEVNLLPASIDLGGPSITHGVAPLFPLWGVRAFASEVDTLESRFVIVIQFAIRTVLPIGGHPEIASLIIGRVTVVVIHLNINNNHASTFGNYSVKPQSFDRLSSTMKSSFWVAAP